MRDVVYVDANRVLFFDVPVRTLYLRSVLVPCVLISPSRRHGSLHVREGREALRTLSSASSRSDWTMDIVSASNL